jgi:hypothetical protein
MCFGVKEGVSQIEENKRKQHQEALPIKHQHFYLQASIAFCFLWEYEKGLF